MNDKGDLTVAVTITKGKVNRQGVHDFLAYMAERHEVCNQDEEITVALPEGMEPKALPPYISGRTKRKGLRSAQEDCYKFAETIHALEQAHGEVKPAADLLKIGYDNFRGRLYGYARKGLVMKVGTDRWKRR